MTYEFHFMTEPTRRVAFSQNFNQMVLCNVCIPLRCSDGSVAQEFLDHSNIDTITKQQGGYRMPKHVGSNMSFDSRVLSELRNDVSDALRREPFTRSVHKQSGAIRSNARSQIDMLPLYSKCLFINHERQTIATSLPLNPKA